MPADRYQGLVEGVEDLLMGLAGEQFDLPGGEADVGVEVTEQLLGERYSGGEAGADAAGFRPAGDLAPAERGGDLGVVVEGSTSARGPLTTQDRILRRQ